MACASLGLAACATAPSRMGGAISANATRDAAGGRYKVGSPYQVNGVWYTPAEQPDYDEVGTASWYGDAFHDKRTANGELFDMYLPSAAHKTLPMPCMVEVTNLANGRSMQVRVNDRGPFVDGRIIDVSRAAADALGFQGKGLTKVRVRYVGPAPLSPTSGLQYAAQSAPTLAAAKPAPVAPPAPAPIVQAAITPPPAPPVGGFSVQAGAYADRANAERVAAQLSSEGATEIQPVQRDGGQLYRVVLRGQQSEGEAWTVRDRVASEGFADAQVVKPF